MAGDGRGVALQEGGQRAVGVGLRRGAQGHREATGAVFRTQSGAQDREHRSGPRVEDGAAAGLPAQPQRVPPVGADRQLHGHARRRPGGAGPPPGT